MVLLWCYALKERLLQFNKQFENCHDESSKQRFSIVLWGFFSIRNSYKTMKRDDSGKSLKVYFICGYLGGHSPLTGVDLLNWKISPCFNYWSYTKLFTPHFLSVASLMKKSWSSSWPWTLALHSFYGTTCKNRLSSFKLVRPFHACTNSCLCCPHVYESHTLIPLLGAKVPANSFPPRFLFFPSSCLLAACPSWLFISTLCRLSPPMLSQIPPLPPLPFSRPFSKRLLTECAL